MLVNFRIPVTLDLPHSSATSHFFLFHLLMSSKCLEQYLGMQALRKDNILQVEQWQILKKRKSIYMCVCTCVTCVCVYMHSPKQTGRYG